MIRAITSFQSNNNASTNFQARGISAESARIRAGIEKFVSRDGGNKLVDTKYAAWKQRQAAQRAADPVGFARREAERLRRLTS